MPFFCFFFRSDLLYFFYISPNFLRREVTKSDELLTRDVTWAAIESLMFPILKEKLQHFSDISMPIAFELQ